MLGTYYLIWTLRTKAIYLQECSCYGKTSEIRDLRSHARQIRHIIDQNKTTDIYGSIEYLDPSEVQRVHSWIEWDEETPVRSVVPRNCPPGTQARTSKVEPMDLDLSFSRTYTTEGFVSDFQSSKNVCLQPDLLHNYSIFTSPPILMTTEALLPLFSQSSLSGVNPEMTIPANIYYQDDPKYWSSNLTRAWSKKETLAFWRGINSGGKHTASNWKGFHRHRFVASMNGTYIRRLAREQTPLWTIPNAGLSNVSSFLECHTDIGFSDFVCADSRWREETQSCSYLDAYYHTLPRIELEGMLQYKYLPDIDGHGHSGTYNLIFNHSRRSTNVSAQYVRIC